VIIRPAKRIEGTITVPGDKSVSHRAAIFAAMADGETRIENYASGADCSSTIACLRQLGVMIEREGPSVVVHGVGKKGFRQPEEPLDCGNSGTTMRLMAGLLAGQTFDSVLTGDDSLRGRPMKRVIQPLRLMGAEIEANEGFAPLTIRGRDPLNAISYRTPVASAQLKSCVLIAGLNSDGETTVVEEIQTRDHTERMFRWLGADVSSLSDADGVRITVNGSSVLNARDILVPGDISSAAFFLVAAGCLPGSNLHIENVGVNSSRAFLLEKLRTPGLEIQSTESSESAMEPVADLRVERAGDLHAKSGSNLVSGSETAKMIDEIPILAVLGTQLADGLEVRDAQELRIKETDRIAALCDNLRRMNAVVEEFDDGFRVERSELKGAKIDSFGDHRIAMAFAVAGLAAEGETEILDHEAADISFPGFYELLESVVQR
jgi:3-phosphoshikimate 1-carboxyvinyltransferase